MNYKFKLPGYDVNNACVGLDICAAGKVGFMSYTRNYLLHIYSRGFISLVLLCKKHFRSKRDRV